MPHVVSELMLSFRDLVHQQTHQRVDMPPRLSIANDAANILCRLDGAAVLRSQWVVSQDPGFVDGRIERITENIATVGTEADRLAWRRILQTRDPMCLARFIVELMGPVKV